MINYLFPRNDLQESLNKNSPQLALALAVRVKANEREKQ